MKFTPQQPQTPTSTYRNHLDTASVLIWAYYHMDETDFDFTFCGLEDTAECPG